MVAIPTLRTGRLILRPFTSEDVPAVEALLASPEIAATTLNLAYPYPPGAAVAWIATHQEQAQDDKAVNSAITRRDSTVIGTISLGLAEKHRRGSVGYWLGTESWNQGYMTEALRTVIDWAFEALGLVRVEASCFPPNPASARVMERAGMTYEGCLRSYVLKQGVAEDVLVYAAVRDASRFGAV